jgi:hypothetical protein
MNIFNYIKNVLEYTNFYDSLIEIRIHEHTIKQFNNI